MKRNNSKERNKIGKKSPVKKTDGRKKQPKKISVKKTPAIELRHLGKDKPMPVVGIGSSAGGLEAFTKFLENLPTNLGMAYVYVQHLSATHESLLPEILERKTNMPVRKTEQDMPIKKDTVYVIPANTIITISDGTLKLQPRREREHFYTIDSFFLSLASTYQENAIGILLSGTGTDGTLGLKAIKAEGGITFAQDDTAKYHDMPNHATEMGYVDFIMPPDKIALQLSLFFDHDIAALREQNEILDNDTDMRKIETIMHTRRNVDFSHYKKTTIHRRILRRMVLHRLRTLGEYARLLKENSTEVNALYNDLLICVTNFFRDAPAYEVLADKILPILFKDRRSNDTLRIWIPGCATGEEAISMAITVLEHLGEKAISTSVQVFATDLNEKAIERARAGIYLKSALQNISPERLEKFFTKIDEQYQVIKAIREMIIYAPHNLLNDPPFSRMDIISCQNVLIYLETNPQNKIMHAFHYALKPTGYLILGRSESIGTASDLFEQLNKDHKIYRKKNISTPLHLDFLTRPFIPAMSITGHRKTPERPKELDLEKETEKVLLKRYMPASVLVNKDLEILRFRGSVSKYLEPATGKASLHLMKMVKEEIVFELRSVINEAKKEGQPVKKQGLHFNGDAKDIAIEVIPIKANAKDNYYLIIFQPGNGIEDGDPRKTTIVSKETRSNQIASLEKQLKEAREHMRMITEEFEATREELQSANEEVLSSNEELQSINEELETSKEELQSTNEELTTINEELQTRNTELQESYEYVESIFETIDEPLLVLRDDLRVKNANKAFYKTFRLPPEETEGNYLYNLSNHEWDIPELRKQLKLVQSKNIEFTDFEIRHIYTSIGEREFLLNAQRLFVKDKKNSLILLSIEDITEHRFSELLLKNAFDIITILSKDGTIIYESESILRVLGYSQNERIGKSIFADPIVHPEDISAKKTAFKKAVTYPEETIRTEFRLKHKDGGYRDIEAIYVNLIANPRVEGIVATYHDITDRKRMEKQKEEFVSIASHELKTPITSVKAYAQILEDSFKKAKDKKSAELLEKMNKQVDRLTTLITDLLDFTRIQGEKLKLREENYNINDLISEIVEEMQRTTKMHEIITKLDRSVQLWGDRYRTGQVLTNLLSNAIKYSPQAKKIIVSSKLAGDKISICVQDFGIGIKKDHLNKVFDRFFRVSESKLNTFPGLGLGLYISREIVKRQGGTIEVKSTEAKGSTFCFSLPLKR